MKKYINKQQRKRLRDLGVEGTLYNVSSIGELISQLPAEVKSHDDRVFRLSMRNLGTKWCVQYVDFTDGERLLGFVWYANQLVDALYKAVKNCKIYSPKVYNTNKTE